MIQFVIYADIHHDEYTNGITLADTISIEDEITQYAYSHGISTIIFAGDWFRATNPLQSVIKSAEAAWKRRSDLGIITYAIPGNHDRWTKAINSGHAFAAAGVFKSDLKNVMVFDTVVLSTIGDTNFLFIPAWHERNLPDRSLLKLCPSGDLVVIFHGMIVGSKLSSGKDANGSVDVDMLRELKANILLGGDNHTPQVLSNIVPNCYYLGAPLQHTWGDRDQNRGFWHIKIENHVPNIMMIPTHAPNFIRLSVSVINEVDAVCKIGEVLNKYINNPPIVEVTLVGEAVGSINKEFIENNILGMGARRATVIIDRSFEKLEIAPQVAKAVTIEDKWVAYVTSGIAPGMTGLDPVVLSDIGLNAVLRARNG